MKSFILAALTALTLSAHAETFSIDGTFNLGHGIFGAGQPAVLSISADERTITASIASPISECVLEFGEGVLESRGSQKIFNKGTYAVYTIPVLKSCQTMATNPVYLVVRKDLEGVLTSVKIMNRSRYNHWVYFSSLK